MISIWWHLTICVMFDGWRCPKVEQDEYLSADVHDYGVFLLELIAGKSASDFEAQGSGQSLIDWVRCFLYFSVILRVVCWLASPGTQALPLLENDSLGEVMDPRIADTNDVRLVHHMARAALFCLKNDSGRRLSISEVKHVTLNLCQFSLGCLDALKNGVFWYTSW